MKKTLLTISGIMAAITFGWTPEAKADLIFCNRIDQPIYMALSQQATGNRSTATIKGWWYAQPGQCQSVYLNQLKPEERYGYFAISADGKRKWNGDANGLESCVNDNGFDLLAPAVGGKTPQCVAPSYPVRFKWMDTENQPNISFDFS
jgi:uncharacterized membrane protein